METLSTQRLIEIKFGNAFDFHPEFFKEFNELVVGSGCEVQIIKQLMSRLGMIIKLKNIDCGLKWLEKLKKHENLYSLHIDVAKTNYRLLFSKVSDKKLFLHVFYEKAGKRVSSYDGHVPIALNRRKEVMGEVIYD